MQLVYLFSSPRALRKTVFAGYDRFFTLKNDHLMLDRVGLLNSLSDMYFPLG